MEGARIGVYVCECGVNISATVDVEAVTQMAASLPGGDGPALQVRVLGARPADDPG